MSLALAIVVMHGLVTLAVIGWLVHHIRRELGDHSSELNAQTQPLPRVTVAELRQRYADRQTPAGAGRAPDRSASAGSISGGTA